MDKKCIGCGVIIQNIDEEKVGYVKSLDHDLCFRCHQIKNFNKKPVTNLTNVEFEKIISEVGKSKKLVVWVIDVFDIEGTKLKIIEEKLKNNPMIIVVNKVDLLPKSIPNEKILDWIDESLSRDLKIKNILLLSAKKKKNIDFLLDEISYYCEDEVYFVGVTNTGKSSIINQIIKSLQLEGFGNITTSYFSGTTLDMITLQISEKIKVIDTPGIVNDKQISNILSAESLKKIIPDKELRPKTYQLNDEQTLFLTGLIQFDYLKGDKSSFTIYCSNNVEIHRTKLEKSDQIREQHLGEELFEIPSKEELNEINNWKEVLIESEEEKIDIVINGFGWVAINGKGNKKIKITTPENIGISQRKALI